MFAVSDLKSNSTYEDIRTKTAEKTVETWLKLILLCSCMTKKVWNISIAMITLHFRELLKSWSFSVCEYHFGMCNSQPGIHQIVAKSLVDPRFSDFFEKYFKAPMDEVHHLLLRNVALTYRIPQGSKKKALFYGTQENTSYDAFVKNLEIGGWMKSQKEANEVEGTTLANFWQNRIKVWYIKY